MDGKNSIIKGQYCNQNVKYRIVLTAIILIQGQVNVNI